MATKDPVPPPTLDEADQVRGARHRAVEAPDRPQPPPGPAPSPQAGAPQAGAPQAGAPQAPAPQRLAAVAGMGWVAADAGERLSLRSPPEDTVDSAPDTSAFRRPSADGLMGKVIAPRVQGGPGSPLEPLLAIPVISVGAAVRPPAPRSPPPPPAEPSPIPRVTLLSSPAPGQACPVCKGPLRVLRTTREDRLDCTWFRLEWLEVERDHADCPRDLSVPTTPLHRPAFALQGAPVGNGLLARIATWRWQDHMPGHDITRLLVALGLRCTDSQVSRWLIGLEPAIQPVAAAIRARCEGGTADAQGISLVDEGKEGRLRATTRGELVAFAWAPCDDSPRPDAPEERARRVLLDARGWSRSGRQAWLRRTVARALATDRDRAARASWTLEELRAATDPTTEAAALARAIAAIGPGDPPDPHLLMAARLFEHEGTDELLRLRPDGRPAADPPLPENARGTLPRWFLGTGDGGAARVADWLTVTESCAGAGVSPWRHLRDLFEAWADGGWQPVDGARWVPGRKG